MISTQITMIEVVVVLLMLHALGVLILETHIILNTRMMLGNLMILSLLRLKRLNTIKLMIEQKDLVNC